MCLGGIGRGKNLDAHPVALAETGYSGTGFGNLSVICLLLGLTLEKNVWPGRAGTLPIWAPQRRPRCAARSRGPKRNPSSAPQDAVKGGGLGQEQPGPSSCGSGGPLFCRHEGGVISALVHPSTRHSTGVAHSMPLARL